MGGPLHLHSVFELFLGGAKFESELAQVFHAFITCSRHVLE